MGFIKNKGTPEDDSVLGPLIGIRRPRYDVLEDIAGDFMGSMPPGDDLFVFVSLNSLLRQLFSEYAASQLSRSELNRHPRRLAAEILNVTGHYRNYAWKHYGRRSTVIVCHSTLRCSAKVAACPGYKHEMYAKRLGDGASYAEMAPLRAYAAFNVRVAAQVAERIPHVHVVDTGEIDPEAWPWLLAAEGRVPGPALVVASRDSDLQYALRGDSDLSGREWAVLRASGDNSRLVRRETLMAEVMRKSKDAAATLAVLRPGHFLYVLSMAGDTDIGVQGIPKFGMARAAKLVAKLAASGRLPSDFPNAKALLEDAGLPPDHVAVAQQCWSVLIHDDCAMPPPQLMAGIDAQMLNRSGLGEIEQANARYFGGSLNIELLFAGEEY